ncbi:hypothetical protein TNCV_853441 [Trichonephila clavipes]|nr:hypothetical protein TNCV_853441 [Trichonephila clavipes]
MTTYHRAWGRKPRLFGENRANSSLGDDNETYERSGQTNAGFYGQGKMRIYLHTTYPGRWIGSGGLVA